MPVSKNIEADIVASHPWFGELFLDSLPQIEHMHDFSQEIC